MRQWFSSVCVLARERWSWVYACAVLMFLLPEYCAPVLAVIALILAWRDIKAARGRGLLGDAGRIRRRRGPDRLRQVHAGPPAAGL